MPVAHQPLAAVIGQLVGMTGEQGCYLGLDGLSQQCSRTAAQNLGQRIGKSSWLGELENVSVGHGVSLLRWRSGSFEHPHDTPPYPLMPSPTFAHSSTPARAREKSLAGGQRFSTLEKFRCQCACFRPVPSSKSTRQFWVVGSLVRKPCRRPWPCPMGQLRSCTMKRRPIPAITTSLSTSPPVMLSERYFFPTTKLIPPPRAG